ncbi:hypothetical protein JCM11491_001412 [Sporobolomyces phaffii]
MSTPDASFDESSPRVHSDSIDHLSRGAEPSPEPTLSAASSPARSTSSCADSLAGLPAGEVERVALEFLTSDPGPDAAAAAAARGGLVDAFDLPRPPLATLTRDQVVELERTALAYLARAVADADADDWKYPTPTVFGPPRRIGLHRFQPQQHAGSAASGGEAAEEGVGWDDKDGNGSAWLDRAFNLESYNALDDPSALTDSLDELDLAEPGPRTTATRDDDGPELVHDGQGRDAFGDSVGDGGYSFVG